MLLALLLFALHFVAASTKIDLVALEVEVPRRRRADFQRLLRDHPGSHTKKKNNTQIRKNVGNQTEYH